ncbi:hypothetical protein D1227_06235 [Henriciella mobilis]|uniref:hypothetical protein n=1 Tax=Henriciella mobilis TaxID=2305467 RepID=UPI000E66DDEE|nr:hypothetical protein [Henriciella mobilis]RIJ15990.1 hypothetical protein D1231_09365 [Henriciella mobilis]RIJ21200.1 hypothetical protein D1227_12905 [Henriciella mobilis]RIJ23099.1 hypothetical protein D1227_06235 [Henriciella mobilis]
MSKPPVFYTTFDRLSRLSDGTKSAHEKMVAAGKAFDQATQEFIRAVVNTPEFSIMKVMSPDGYDSHKNFDVGRQRLTFTAHEFAQIGGQLSLRVDREASETTRPVSLDSKTLNLLLSGKVLSEDEKRQLLVQQGLGFLSEEGATQ